MRRGTPAPVLSTSSAKLYFGTLHLQPIRIDITFSMGQADLLKNLLPEEGVLSVLSTVIEASANFLANIDNAPLQLNQLRAHHVYESSETLMSRLTDHYTYQALGEWYKILGSVDFLGNPVGLVSSIGSNVASFFYEPAKGALVSPSEFGQGFVKGTKTLLSSTTTVVGSAGKVVSTMSKGLRTFDGMLALEDKNAKKSTARGGASRAERRRTARRKLVGVSCAVARVVWLHAAC